MPTRVRGHLRLCALAFNHSRRSRLLVPWTFEEPIVPLVEPNRG